MRAPCHLLHWSRIEQDYSVKASDCSLLLHRGTLSGLSDLSPVSSFVIESANKINFTAPLTMVGAFAGISIGNEIKAFAKQGWKMIIIALLVMTGTFFGSALVANIILSLTHAI